MSCDCVALSCYPITFKPTNASGFQIIKKCALTSKNSSSCTNAIDNPFCRILTKLSHSALVIEVL